MHRNLGRIFISILFMTACSGDNVGGLPDAAVGSADAKPGTPDATPGTPDARPGSPDAAPHPDAAPQPDAGATGTPTAFRLDSLALLDPHIFYAPLFCTDATSIANNQIGAQLNGDSNNNGKLDFSALLVMEPLNQGASAHTSGEFMIADCTAPAATSTCTPGDTRVTTTITNQSSGTCLGPLANTTTASYGTVPSTSGPCFDSSPITITLDIQGAAITLENAQVAAVYDTDPAGNLTSGLIRGFLSETDADNITFPDPLNSSNPDIVLSSTLPGGKNCCVTSHTDLDHDANGVAGWYFYLSFTAVRAGYTP